MATHAAKPPVAEETHDQDPAEAAPNAEAAVNLPEGEEIAGRTTDTDEKSTQHYTKKFVVSGPYDKDRADAYFSDNADQMASVVQDLINAGLRVDGDVTYAGSYPNPDGEHDGSYVVEYTVPVIRARDAEGGTVSPRQILQANTGDEDAALLQSDAEQEQAQASSPEQHEHANRTSARAAAAAKDKDEE